MATTNWNIDNTLSWLRGKHSLTFGSSFTQLNHARTVWNVVPTLAFTASIATWRAASGERSSTISLKTRLTICDGYQVPGRRPRVGSSGRVM